MRSAKACTLPCQPSSNGGPRRPGSAGVLADDEQARVLPSAERAGEGGAVQVDRGPHLAAHAHPHAVLVTTAEWPGRDPPGHSPA